MTLQGPEDEEFDLRSNVGSKEFILAARFFTKQVLNIDAIAGNFSQLWRTRDGFKIKDQGNHIFLFIFRNEFDCDRIFTNQPWSFNKFLVVFQRYSSAIPIRDLAFKRVPFWVQVYDISISFMNKKAAEGLCLRIGEVCPTDFSIMEGGDHLRVHVVIDITKPLCRGLKITLDGGNTGWVSFKYERLPSICYWCGYLIHRDKDCDLWINSEGTLTEKDRKYGVRLRAPLSNQIRKTTVVVPGFYQQKKDSKSSKDFDNSIPSKNPHATMPKTKAPKTSPLKVIPNSSLAINSNSVSCPISRDLMDFPP